MLSRRCITLQLGEIVVSSEQISHMFMKITQDCHKNDERRQIDLEYLSLQRALGTTPNTIILQISITWEEHVIPETLGIYVRRVLKASCVFNLPLITSIGFFLSLQRRNWVLSLFPGDVVMIVIKLI